jgi:methionyl-tRNA formyltransferase
VAKINGLYAKPLAFCVYNGINIKIHQAKEIKLNREITDVGVIIEVSSSGIVVTTKTNFILLEKIQLPSKNPVSVKDLVNGNHIFKVNTKFN